MTAVLHQSSDPSILTHETATTTALKIEDDTSIAGSTPVSTGYYRPEIRPKRFRLYPRYDRSLLGRLSREAWLCTKQIYQEALGRERHIRGHSKGATSYTRLIRSAQQALRRRITSRLPVPVVFQPIRTRAPTRTRQSLGFEARESAICLHSGAIVRLFSRCWAC